MTGPRSSGERPAAWRRNLIGAAGVISSAAAVGLWLVTVAFLLLRLGPGAAPSLSRQLLCGLGAVVATAAAAYLSKVFFADPEDKAR